MSRVVHSTHPRKMNFERSAFPVKSSECGKRGNADHFLCRPLPIAAKWIYVNVSLAVVVVSFLPLELCESSPN